jgi:hypothetical protein
MKMFESPSIPEEELIRMFDSLLGDLTYLERMLERGNEPLEEDAFFLTRNSRLLSRFERVLSEFKHALRNKQP